MVCQRPSRGLDVLYPRKYCRLSSLAMPAVAGSRSRAETMISVRPPLSSVIDRSASTFRRALDEFERRAPEELDELDEDDAGGGDGGGALAPGNAEGVGVDRGAAVEPPVCCGAFEYDDVDEPDASMPMAYTRTSDSRMSCRTALTSVRLF